MALTLAAASPALACGILQIKNGYFWDPALGNYFLPRGFAYQTFNPPVGANQSLDQLAYDLTEFKKMYANSARVEMVWGQVETAQGVYDWSQVDFLVAKAEELGIRLFVIVGFQYAPYWFSNSWTAVNDTNGPSVVVNYEHPQVRAAYSNYVFLATQRYKDSGAIAAWILGNEYSYFDLWNPDRHLLGYDPISQASFRSYLASIYATNIALLNANWRTSYTDFNSVVMPTTYPPDRNGPAYFDLIQWRKKSIGDYVALGAVAARKADTNHLLTYSMVGGVFSPSDHDYTCEDAKTIVARCAAAGAPLNFWSVNNYAITSGGSDLRSADFGISKYQAQSGLPVLVTETGHSSTDNLDPEEPQRYGNALPGQVWEALMSGAIGVHIFTWNDRDLFAGTPTPREVGFGIVHQIRTPKDAVYWNIQDTFRRTENANLTLLLGGTTNPAPNIQFFWSTNSDLVWPTANIENLMVWGALKRLGYEPGLIDDDQFAAGAATNAPALLLSRCWALDPAQLDSIVTNVIPAGVHVHANADFPGQFNAYHVAYPRWTNYMNTLFGLNLTNASPQQDQSGISDPLFMSLYFSGMGTLGSFTPSYTNHIGSWRVWGGIPTNSGTIAVHYGAWNQGPSPALPALQIKNLGTAKTALNTFAVGNVESFSGDPFQQKWDFRYQWLGAVYSNYFGIQPTIKLSGPGATYVYPDYRFCRNGSVLVSLLNGDTNTASVTVTAPSLLAGKTIENLTSGGIVATNSTGAASLNMPGDSYVLLYAYNSAGGIDQSLINTNWNKLWISAAPQAVWPTGSNYNLTLSYSLRDSNLTVMAGFERVLTPNLVFAQTNGPSISGTGSVTVPLLIPDADPNNAWYISSLDGGDYVFHAWLVKSGTRVADTYLPVRLLWAVRPLTVPASVLAGRTYQVTVEWQELPSYLPSEGSAPLDRARLWQPYLASLQYYKVVLQLLSAGQVIQTQQFLSNIGTGEHTFTVTVPSGATGPFTWTAHLQTAPGAAVDIIDSFEDRDTGADSAITNGPPLFAPWQLATYAEDTNVAGQMYLDAGVGTNSSDGSQGVFFLVTNPPTVGSFSGTFLSYTYPQPWALPRDLSQWTNFTFAFDFKEARGLSCVLEMQVKDTRGGVINFTKPYTPAASGWDTISASLDRFPVPSWSGQFDSEHVSQLVLNIQLLTTNAQYLGYMDNVRFVGLKTVDQTVAPLDIWDNFDNRPATNGLGGWAALSPWSTYVYPPPPSRELDRGIVLYQGIDGGQAAMMVVTNPAGLGPISSFGLYRPFTNTWALPPNTNSWTNYVFSYSFREANFRSCSIEMQVKSGTNNWIEFTKTYTPDATGWDTVRASLKQFVQPTGIGAFDPASVQGIALNVRVFQTNATYVGFFDNAYFDTPDTLVPSGTSFGLYQSSNDSAPDNTVLQIQSIRTGPGGQITLSWLAQSNRSYTVEYQDVALYLDCFQPLYTNLLTPTNGLLQAVDTNSPPAQARFYRIHAQPR